MRQYPVLKRQPPRSAPASRIGPLALQHGDQRAELPEFSSVNGSVQDGSSTVVTPATARSSHP